MYFIQVKRIQNSSAIILEASDHLEVGIREVGAAANGKNSDKHGQNVNMAPVFLIPSRRK